MISSRKYLHELIDQTPAEELPDILDFIKYINIKRDIRRFKELEEASHSSTEFWDNDIDDEVWNNV